MTEPTDSDVDYLLNGFQHRAVPAMESEKFLIEFKEPDPKTGARAGPFVANPFQRELDDSVFPGQQWHVILKPRQVGISTYVDLRGLAECLLVEGTRAVIVSHEKDATTRLLRKVHLAIRDLKARQAVIGEEPVETEFASKFEITFPRKRSYLYIGTAGQKAFSRGDSITFFHGSEVAFWPEAAHLMSGVVGALVSSAEVFLESTANGQGGYFYEMVKKCMKPGGPAKLHFFPWHRFKEYSTKLPPGTAVAWTAEETALAQRFRLTPEQLWWRRIKMAQYDSADLFYQEFPMTVDEAFIVSGACFFDKEALREAQSRIKKPLLTGTVESVGPRALPRAAPADCVGCEKGDCSTHWLSIYAHPRADRTYVMAIDASEGVDGADPMSMLVLDRERAAETAWAYGIYDPNDTAKMAYALGQLYNWPWIGVEDNGPGLAVLMALVTLGYPRIYHRVDPMSEDKKPRIGWHTDPRTRPLMLGTLRSMLKTRVWGPASARFLNQCTTFCRQNDGGYRANSGAHDDDVMCAAIAARLNSVLPHDVPPSELERESRGVARDVQSLKRGHKTGY